MDRFTRACGGRVRAHLHAGLAKLWSRGHVAGLPNALVTCPCRPDADLMWLAGSGAAAHRVTLSRVSAPAALLEARTLLANVTNIFTPAAPLLPLQGPRCKGV